MSTEPTPTHEPTQEQTPSHEPAQEATAATGSTSTGDATTGSTSTGDAQPTEITARGGDDPWADTDASAEADGGALPTARAQRLFDPRSVARLRNLVDDENAYCN